MYMASAIDFIFIFVSLELVTISFYVLVTFTRRNPTTLEAGVKYLVLSALSTAFLVYGITWIFGATGQTNLQRITEALANSDTDHVAALFGMVLVLPLRSKLQPCRFKSGNDVYQRALPPVTAYSRSARKRQVLSYVYIPRPFLMQNAIAPDHNPDLIYEIPRSARQQTIASI
jgi:NADH-quinone oxidoreductase subunit N